MKIVPIPCLEDNYSYLIIDDTSRESAVMEPRKVLQVAEDNWADLRLVLTTHHHWDHAGGNDEMKNLKPKIKVFGGVKGCPNKVVDGDNIVLGVDTKISCLLTPCHTKGHISYYVTGKEGELPAVFTGDTLFVGACGKFFEGTAEQMHQSLLTLRSLPRATRVYRGHEYTVKNLQFASAIEPDNPIIAQKLSWAKHQRLAGLPTVPSTILEELDTNLFMRVGIRDIQMKVGCKTPVQALQELRQRKDNWTG